MIYVFQNMKNIAEDRLSNRYIVELYKEEMKVCNEEKVKFILNTGLCETTNFHGEKVFIRSDIESLFSTIEKISKYNGIPLIDIDETNQIMDWPDYILDKYTKRKVLLTKLKYFKNIKNKNVKLFAKTRNKRWNFFDILSNIYDGFKSVKIDDNEKIIISEPLNLLEKESRYFIINNKVFGDRRNQEKIDFVEGFVKDHKNIFSGFYCLDINKDKDLGYVVIELNPINASGYREYANRINFRDIINELRIEND